MFYGNLTVSIHLILSNQFLTAKTLHATKRPLRGRGCRSDHRVDDVGARLRCSRCGHHVALLRVRNLDREHGLHHVHYTHDQVYIHQDWLHSHPMSVHRHDHHVGGEDVHHVDNRCDHCGRWRCVHIVRCAHADGFRVSYIYS